LVARIALMQADLDGAREQARFAQQDDPTLAMPAFINGRILYEQGKYEESLRAFEEAVAVAKRPGSTPIRNLHFHVGETLARLERHSAAEQEFLNELRRFPLNVRARAALATLYHATGQHDAADKAIADMIRTVPTPETYTVAARLWASFGQMRQAQTIRAEGRRAFTENRPRASTDK
jgi:tetratricopeptide (TPR) repeat protein